MEDVPKNPWYSPMGADSITKIFLSNIKKLQLKHPKNIILNFNINSLASKSNQLKL